MAVVTYKQINQLAYEDFVVYNALPAHPYWTKVAETIDFSFADVLCAPLYSPQGQRPYAPSLKLKIHLVQRYHNYSDRQMEEAMAFDISIKRFLGLPIAHKGLDHSTVALDRERLGGDLFEACHQHILAQALDRKLWGNTNSRWLIDAFHTHANVARPGTHRLIQQAALRIIHFLKGTYLKLHDRLLREQEFQTMSKRLSRKVPEEKQSLAFSRLVVEAYSLLHWLESETISPLFWAWENKQHQLQCLELQAVLIQVLQENSKPASVDPQPRNAETTNTSESVEQPELEFIKIPKKEKPSDRIVSAFDPEVRTGYKSPKQPFTGDKVQLIEDEVSGLLLSAKVIAGNEADGQAMPEMVVALRDRYHIAPQAAVADSAYGHGPQRQAMMDAKVPLSAPVVSAKNSQGLFDLERFAYDPDKKTFTCPKGQTSIRQARNEKERGTQHFFDKEACAVCPLREACTTSKSGRSVFMSDYYDLMNEAKAYNETEEGKAAQKERYRIERTNNELKNHHGLNRARTRGRARFRVDVLLGVMVVNIKRMAKMCGSWDPCVLRRYPPRKASVCP
jgi:hypothetical protein